jgi:hypothetical protein
MSGDASATFAQSVMNTVQTTVVYSGVSRAEWKRFLFAGRCSTRMNFPSLEEIFSTAKK